MNYIEKLANIYNCELCSPCDIEHILEISAEVSVVDLNKSTRYSMRC